MSKMTLDLNSLSVESFSANDPAGAAGDVTTFAGANADTPLSLTLRVCCEAIGVEACTVKEPCCDVTP